MHACQVCGGRATDVHHLTYDRFGHEDMGDLVSLCRRCHSKIVDLQNEINADIDRLVDIKREVREMIESVPSVEGRTILEMRYINYKKWKEIAVSMHYVLRNVRYIHDKAIEYLDSKYGE